MHRGMQARKTYEWEQRQRRTGYADGRAGFPPQAADQHYMRGWRRGREVAKRQPPRQRSWNSAVFERQYGYGAR